MATVATPIITTVNAASAPIGARAAFTVVMLGVAIGLFRQRLD